MIKNLIIGNECIYKKPFYKFEKRKFNIISNIIGWHKN